MYTSKKEIKRGSNSSFVLYIYYAFKWNSLFIIMFIYYYLYIYSSKNSNRICWNRFSCFFIKCHLLLLPLYLC